MKKRNIIIIILVMIVILLIGYIIYDKFINEDRYQNDSNIIDNDNTEEQKLTEKALTSGYLLDLMTNSDKEKINDSSNYQNINITIGDLSLIFNCTGFGGEPGDYCYSTEILLNQNKIHSYIRVAGDSDTNPYLIITDKYLIIQKTDSYTIDIYDKLGNNLTSIKNIVFSYYQNDGSTYRKEPMYLQNEKLFFLTYETGDGNFHNPKQIFSKYIDLSDNNFNIIDNNNSFTGIITCHGC